MKKILYSVLAYIALLSPVHAKAEYALDDFTNAAIAANYAVVELFLAKNAVVYLDKRKQKLSGAEFLTLVKKGFAKQGGWPFTLNTRSFMKTSRQDILLFKQTLNNEKHTLTLDGVLIEKQGMWKLSELDISLPLAQLFLTTKVD